MSNSVVLIESYHEAYDSDLFDSDDSLDIWWSYDYAYETSSLRRNIFSFVINILVMVIIKLHAVYILQIYCFSSNFQFIYITSIFLFYSMSCNLLSLFAFMLKFSWLYPSSESPFKLVSMSFWPIPIILYTFNTKFNQAYLFFPCPSPRTNQVLQGVLVPFNREWTFRQDLDAKYACYIWVSFLYPLSGWS